MAPGFSSVTTTGAPSASTKTRNSSVKAFTACFEAEYTPCSATARCDSVEPTLISAPPPRRSTFRAAREP